MEEYEYIATLGEGAYGYVWKCVERTTGRLVAIKGFKQAHEEPEIMKLAVREVRVLQALHHPAVVRLLEAFRSKSGRVYMVFPFIGRSAFQEMDRCAAQEQEQQKAGSGGGAGGGVVAGGVYGGSGGLPPALLKLLAFQVLHALAYLHDLKICHRDIKPANILINDDGSGEVVLCDFGFARHTRCGPRDVQQLSTYVVTRWYRAPEVLLSDQYGPAADIWSLGCTLAELASGQPLFPGRSTADQLYRIMRCYGRLPPDMDARLAADARLAGLGVPAPGGRSLRERLRGADTGIVRLVESCLQVDPRRRPTAAQLLAAPYFWGIGKLIAGTRLEPVYGQVAAAAAVEGKVLLPAVCGATATRAAARGPAGTANHHRVAAKAADRLEPAAEA